MGNSNSKTQNEQKEKFTGSLQLPIKWEDDTEYENPLSQKAAPLPHLPRNLLKHNNEASKEGDSNVYWNGYGYGQNPEKDYLEKEQWEIKGKTVDGGFSHSITQKVEGRNNYNEEEPRISKSISNRSSKNKSSSKIPPLEIEKAKKNQGKKEKDDSQNHKIYTHSLPRIHEESFRFLKLDNPRIRNLRGKKDVIEGIDILNKRALRGNKKKINLRLETVEDRDDLKQMEIYPIRPKNTIDMEMDDINDIESTSGINYVLHSSKHQINNISFTKKIKESFVDSRQIEEDNFKKRKSTVLREKEKNFVKKGGEEKNISTQRPKELSDFRVKFDDLSEISERAFLLERSRKFNKGKLQIEISVPDSNFYSPNYFKICPLPFDVEQTERGENIEMIYDPELNKIFQNKIEVGGDTPISPGLNQFKVSLLQISERERDNLSNKIKLYYNKLWEELTSDMDPENNNLNVSKRH